MHMHRAGWVKVHIQHESYLIKLTICQMTGNFLQSKGQHHLIAEGIDYCHC